MHKKFIILAWCLMVSSTMFAYNRQDSLRGSNGKHRAWWDVQYYTLNIAFDTAKQAISGSNTIKAKIVSTPTDSLQLDLQELMFLDSVVMDGKKLDFSKEGNVWWIENSFKEKQIGSKIEFTAYYHGKPQEARNPPWDGGFIWKKDALRNPWISVACQGLGAGSWWPCKDYQGDEPDNGMNIGFEFPCEMQMVSNGKEASPEEAMNSLSNKTIHDNCYKFFNVENPINNYNVTFYLGNYSNWTDTFMGEKGVLHLSFYPLAYNLQKSKQHFKDVKTMLRCFEYWMGPYPFYEDGYKLVEAPFSGMEHQSGIAYGNHYKNGYNGIDRSGTGHGFLFDFIIVHESGHEWFGNNITAQDVADNWIHEGFTTYTETLFLEWIAGKEKAFEYVRGEWKNIRNDRPIIGNYGVNDQGSGDKYDKGAAVVHMIRMMLDNDENFKELLRGLNKDFYHAIVTTKEIEDYISQFTGKDLSAFFEQYLRTTKIPQFEYYIKGKKIFFRFTNVVEGFSLPLIATNGKKSITINPTNEWQSKKWKGGFNINLSKDFLIRL